MSCFLIKVKPNATKGLILSYNESLLYWDIAQDFSSVVCVLLEDSFVDPDDSSVYWGKAVFKGVAHAIASRSIPEQGGFLHIENGKVYVDQSISRGTILPKTIEESSREVNSEVMVYLS